jgi:hypothetical protein
MAETPDWKPIVLSAKVFGHISQGLYRTPAGAIKELISNAYDAGAERVKIHTAFPVFNSFSCEDDGKGMSEDEFIGLMTGGIGYSEKRRPQGYPTEFGRPVIGRLGVGLLSVAQICSQFNIVSHHKESETAFSATIKFPPYTRQDIDKFVQEQKTQDKKEIHSGEYSIQKIPYEARKKGLKIFTRHLRLSFTRRMKDLKRYGNKKFLRKTGPYEDFDAFVRAIYTPRAKSLFFLSDYDQLIFGLAVASPLPYLETGRSSILLKLPSIQQYQEKLKSYKFSVDVDNLTLARPVSVPSDMFGTKPSNCVVSKVPEAVSFKLEDGSYSEKVSINKYEITVKQSDLTLRFFDLQYKSEINSQELSFDGYLFQQTGRLYPKEIQGILIRLRNIAIGGYSADALTYPFGEGPRFPMISAELLVNNGLEDALNIDRDSFNTLDPHYLRVQAYMHSLLHEVIFPESWFEEKSRNKRRRDAAASDREHKFVVSLSKVSPQPYNSISLTKQTRDKQKSDKTRSEREADKSPVVFDAPKHKVEINTNHPLTETIFKSKKNAQLVSQIMVAFERANKERDEGKRRALFYRLLQDIFAS